MKRSLFKKGLPPGQTVFTGEKKVEKIDIHYMEFNGEELDEMQIDNETITSFHEPVDNFMQWYDVRGLHDTQLVDEFGKVFKIHPLVLEDIVDVHNRSKFDEYDDGIYICLRSLEFIEDTKEVVTEQLSIYFGHQFVLSFQERSTDVFAEVRQRVRSARGRVRSRGSDYLAYALIDTIIDGYFVVIEHIESHLELLEEEVADNPNEETKSKIHHYKNQMLKIRKTISPLREAVSQFGKSDNELILDRTQIFVRDAYDHTIQIMDMVESYRDKLTSLHDLFISEISFKMNKIMQILTVVTTVFVPLSFLAGLYGMNFEYMPELKYKYAYFILLGSMGIIALTALLLFRRKHWL